MFNKLKIVLVSLSFFLGLTSNAQFEITCLFSDQDIVTRKYTTTLHWSADTNVCGGNVVYEVYFTNSTNDVGTRQITVSGTNTVLGPGDSQPKYIYVKSVKSSCLFNSTTPLIEAKVGIQPAAPTLDSITVNELSQPVITWENPERVPLKAHKIFFFDFANNNSSTFRDSITASTTYTDTVTISNNPIQKAHNQQEEYKIVLIDACGVESAVPTTSFKTIFLDKIYDKCARTARLNWTPYEHFGFGVKNYEVHSIKNGKDSVLATTTDTVYTHTDLDFSDTVYYYVRALENATNKTSTSNRDTVMVQSTRALDTLDIIKVNIVNSQPVITAIVDDSTYYNYKLFRAENSGSMTLLNTIVVGDTNVVTYTDFTALPKENQYSYQIIGFDSCGIPLDSSSVHQPAFLKVESGSFLNTLTWTNYSGKNSSGTYSDLFRLKDHVWEDSTFFSTASTSTTQKIDSLRLFFESDNEFCYYIETVFNANTLTEKDTVRSNIACDKQQTLIFVPNALHAVQGNEFKPKGSFIADEDYELQIFNRWGITVFESVDKHVGWNGKEAPTGTYIYHIRYKIKTGQTFEKKGWFLLLR